MFNPSQELIAQLTSRSLLPPSKDVSRLSDFCSRPTRICRALLLFVDARRSFRQRVRGMLGVS